MYDIKCDVAIIGAGPAGLSAAIAAKREGADKVLIIERDKSIGGILQQCIHPGFGLTYFKQELTGPEYAGRFGEEAIKLGVEIIPNTMVLEVLPKTNEIICVNSEYGMTKVQSKSIVLAMGCRERTRANIQIPGTRPSGIYTAGSAQQLVNRKNTMVGKNVVILGSGDIGMIMARRMSLEGAKVLMVVEIMDYLAGLTRNKVQCLDDFEIPLKLSHTITKIVGNERIEGVYVAQVDKHKKPMGDTEKYIACDTLLLSVGLLPENELTRKAEIKISGITNGPEVNQYMQTAVSGVFACGNVVHVNDLVDNVTVESMEAGKYAARYAMGQLGEKVDEVETVTGNNVRYLCPQRLRKDHGKKAKLFFRVLHPDCNVRIVAKCGEDIIASKKEHRINPGEMCFIQIPMEQVNQNVFVEIVKEVSL